MFATGDNAGGGSGQPSGPWAKYLQLLDSHPFLTRTVTCAILNGFGEARLDKKIVKLCIMFDSIHLKLKNSTKSILLKNLL